jgi:thiamine-monophosphate kinase
VACNLSDCAAMAVKPLAATVSVAWPRNRPLEDAKRLYKGMEAIAAEYDLAIVGGDTTRWSHPLAIDVAISAVPYEGIEPIRRGGAKLGDWLYVTGPLGGSLADKHLTFTPRVREAHALARLLGPRLHAMIDVSDGLALDLHRLCRASGVGATLEEENLERVISPAARGASANSGRTALEHALSDGEDFELLLGVEGEAVVKGVDLLPVGRITVGPLTLHKADGNTVPLKPEGYVH